MEEEGGGGKEEEYQQLLKQYDLDKKTPQVLSCIIVEQYKVLNPVQKSSSNSWCYDAFKMFRKIQQ